MSNCQIWIERNSSLKLRLRGRPVPVVYSFDVRKRDMRLRQRVIEFQRLLRGFLGFRKSFLWGSKNEDREFYVTFGHPGISQCVSWILGDGLLKVFDSFPEALLV